jgi:hypothetical protein
MQSRIILSLLILGLAAGACQDHAANSPTPAEDPDWIKLEIPKGRVASAVYGNLDNILVVTTYKDAYYTTDKGATWHKTVDFATEKQALVARHDTLIALNKAGTDARGHQVAVRGEYYSPDRGRTWTGAMPTAQYYAYGRLRQRVDSVQANGVAYQFKLNYSPVRAGSSSFYAEPSDLLRTQAGRQTSMRLPAKHVLRNVYLDAQNRLYVTVASCEHRNSLTECADCQPENGLQSPAVVYVSRKPLP